MGLAFKRAKVYVRLIVLAVTVIAVGAVLLGNRKNEVSVWFFGLIDPTESINVVWLIASTAVATLICSWVFRFSWAVLREVREVGRLQSARDLKHQQDEKEKELDQRERRLDTKLKEAIAQDFDDPDSPS